MWPTPCGTDTMRPVFIREAAHCVLYSSGLFSCGRRVGTSHFLSSSNSPGGRPSLACPPTPAGPADPASRLTTELGKPASFPSSGRWHACASHCQGLAAVPVADCLICVSSRECRLINAGQALEASKRSWWLNPPCSARMRLPVKWKRRAQGQCWWEGSSVVFSTGCFSRGCAPTAFWHSGFKTCSVLPVSRELSPSLCRFTLVALWFFFGRKDNVDIFWANVVSRRLLCIEQLCIVQNYVPPSSSVAKHKPREAHCKCFPQGWQRSPLQDENVFTLCIYMVVKIKMTWGWWFKEHNEVTCVLSHAF